MQSGGVNPNGLYSLGSSGTISLDQRNGKVQWTTLSAALSLSLINGYIPGDEIVLIIGQNATGGFAVPFTGTNLKLGA